MHILQKFVPLNPVKKLQKSTNRLNKPKLAGALSKKPKQDQSPELLDLRAQNGKTFHTGTGSHNTVIVHSLLLMAQ